MSVLRPFAFLVLAGMLSVSTWASLKIGLTPAILELAAKAGEGINPWFIATLFDAYFGFLWFWLWIAYREVTWTRRLVWLALVLCLGNFAMAAYVLLALRRLPPGAGPEVLLLRPA